jgi:hypothetical protein
MTGCDRDYVLRCTKMLARKLTCCLLLGLVGNVVGRTPSLVAACEPFGNKFPRRAITSLNATHFSEDAAILTARAARVVSGPWLCAKQAARFDRDLRHIRARFPTLTDVHAVPGFVLDQVLIQLDDHAPWRTAWMNGTVNTGNSQVDPLLERFRAAAIMPLTVHSLLLFLVRFAQPLNVPALVSKLRSASPYFAVVQPNNVVALSATNQLTFEKQSGKRLYKFSFGCEGVTLQSQSTWEIAISPRGTIRRTAVHDAPCVS